MSGAPKAEFDACASEYDEQLQRGLAVSGEGKTYFISRRIDWILHRLGPFTEELTVMDYGCGTGSATPLLLQKLPLRKLIGVDMSEKSLEVARSNTRDDRVSYSTIDTFTPSGDVDLVYCNGVFHHIPPGERAGSLGFIAQSLRPGGYFALCENNPWNPGTRWVMSRIPFDRDAVTLSPPECHRLVAHNGFDVLRRDSLFYFPKALSFLRFLEPAFASLPLGAQYMVLSRKADNTT